MDKIFSPGKVRGCEWWCCVLCTVGSNELVDPLWTANEEHLSKIKMHIPYNLPYPHATRIIYPREILTCVIRESMDDHCNMVYKSKKWSANLCSPIGKYLNKLVSLLLTVRPCGASGAVNKRARHKFKYWYEYTQEMYKTHQIKTEANIDSISDLCKNNHDIFLH